MILQETYVLSAATTTAQLHSKCVGDASHSFAIYVTPYLQCFAMSVVQRMRTAYMIYDVESLPNIFTAAFSDGSLFEISLRKDESRELIQFLSSVDELVGFNNIEYDYPLLHFIIENRHGITAELIYERSVQLIKTSFMQSWRNRIRENLHVIRQVDLRLIHQFNNSTRLTSLKDLQFAMRLPTLEEFSIGFERALTSSEVKQLIKYQRHDVDSTVEFFNRSKDKIDFRRSFERDTGIPCMNLSDGKLGGKYFERELEKMNPGCLYENGARRQTPRKPPFVIPKFTSGDIESYNSGLPKEFHLPDKPNFDVLTSKLERFDFKTDRQYNSAMKKQGKEVERAHKKNRKDIDKWLKKCKNKHERNLKSVWVPVKDIVFDYIEFEHSEFRQVLQDYKNYNITQTKEGFSKVCNIGGVAFHFGQGGIHGSIDNATIRSNKDFIIRDVDIKGAYPRIAIANKLYPAHLGEIFCEVYEDVFNRREEYKKGTTLNLALKLVVNAVFGNSINEYSIFYDPAFGMQITVNGQLLVCMLAEQLMNLNELQLIQINTDGLTIRYPKEFTPWVESIERWWMDLTKLELENVNYQAMFIRDVNNYIGWFEGGERKRKGVFAYEVKPGELEWHKNHSGLVIPKAVEAFLIQGVEVGHFIRNHRDMFDFMMRGKVNRTDRLVIVNDDEEVDQQRTLRFYFSTMGGELYKYMPPLAREIKLAKEEDREPKPRRNAYQGTKGWKVTACNNMKDFNGDIDYSYYIDKAEKMIESLNY